MNRRELLRGAGATAAGVLLPGALAAKPLLARAPVQAVGHTLTSEENGFLEELTRRGCDYFWEHGHPATGQVLDRARASGPDNHTMASIAATGFGLTALCIADARGYYPRASILERVRRTLEFHWTRMPQEHGFYYHFSDAATGFTARGSELSSIDTALLLAGVLTCRTYFRDAMIQDLATKIYEGVDWPWMLDNGLTFSMGWFPESGFLPARWNTYSEEMMMYLMAIGSPTKKVSPDHWTSIARPQMAYDGIQFIGTTAPLFIHQYSHAWVDFRDQRDNFLDYFENSIRATQAHRQFCLDQKGNYNDDYWGITASDSIRGYQAWGGPPVLGHLDGSVVPCATAGSLPFLPQECLRVLMALRKKYESKAWGKYGFVDAFNPTLSWYDADVLGIDVGIGVLMAENLRSGMVWSSFMRNPEIGAAMRLCHFRGEA